MGVTFTRPIGYRYSVDDAKTFFDYYIKIVLYHIIDKLLLDYNIFMFLILFCMILSNIEKNRY